MKETFDIWSDELKEKHIRPSHQRLMILDYLNKNRTHPSVEQIYLSLKENVPTLSKTTIYNTLKILEDAGLVEVITIDSGETRYDINTQTHGHFMCENCGRIFDFNTELDTAAICELADFEITDESVYIKGICPKCLGKDQNRLDTKENGNSIS